MDHAKVLKRAWEILWRYRVLWIFGVIVALTAAGASPTFFSFGGDGDGGQAPPYGSGEWPPADVLPGAAEAMAPVAGIIVAVVLGLACLFVIFIIARVVFLYISETALIRMVDDYEETGERWSIFQGFRLGWSRTALRLFVIDLLTRLPMMFVLLLLLVLGLGFFGLLIWAWESAVVTVIGVVAAIGLGFLAILLGIIVTLVVSLIRPLFFRMCALEEVGVIESLREGFEFVRAHLTDTVLMWLIMIGLQIGWAIALIPVAIFLVLIGMVLGGVAGIAVGGMASLFSSGAVPWILGLSVGIPIFIVVLAAPLAFLNGLAEVFKSSVWTLTYRELRALEAVGAEGE